MVQKNVVVKNPTGLHARPASQLVSLSKTFKSKIKIEAGNRSCDAKSMLSVLRCCIKIGETVTVTADGEDETRALEYITALIDTLEE